MENGGTSGKSGGTKFDSAKGAFSSIDKEFSAGDVRQLLGADDPATRAEIENVVNMTMKALFIVLLGLGIMAGTIAGTIGM